MPKLLTGRELLLSDKARKQRIDPECSEEPSHCDMRAKDDSEGDKTGVKLKGSCSLQSNYGRGVCAGC